MNRFGIRTGPTIAHLALVLAGAVTATTTATAQGDQTPKPVAALTPGTAIYRASLEIDGKLVPLDMARTVKLEKGAWVVTEVTTMSNYVSIDSVVLDRKTLVPRRRVLRDPTLTMDVQFAGNTATGTITARGQTRPISIDMHGVLFADGPGSQDAIAALPLRTGYSAEFLNFDTGTQQVSQLQLRVLGTDTVTVPAGTFNTWKVLTTSATGGPGETAAYWIDKKTRRVVKFASTLLEHNEIIATAELTK
jgi:hypothetical protein